MRYGIKDRLLFSLLLVCYLLFSYYFFNGWWYSSIGSLLIVGLSYFIWGKDFLAQTGLSFKLSTALKALVLTAAVTVSAYLLMKYIADRNKIVIEYTSWQAYYHNIFYILNEELVLGAILLFSLVKKLKIKPFAACLLLAVFFSLIHFVFYRWIFLERGLISITTLASLFLVGFIRNSLILLSGHIAYSWALHFGWMIIMFGSMHSYTGTDMAVSEPDRFNLYLGSTEMLLLSGLLAAVFGLIWLSKSKPFKK